MACETLEAVEVGCSVTCHRCNSRFLGGISFHECVMVGMFYCINNGFLLCSSVFWQCSWWIFITRNISFRVCGSMRKDKVVKHDDIRAVFTIAFE